MKFDIINHDIDFLNSIYDGLGMKYYSEEALIKFEIINQKIMVYYISTQSYQRYYSRSTKFEYSNEILKNTLEFLNNLFNN